MFTGPNGTLNLYNEYLVAFTHSCLFFVETSELYYVNTLKKPVGNIVRGPKHREEKEEIINLIN